MDTNAISELCKKLEQEEKLLQELKKEASLLNLNGHQEQITVSFSGKTRAIAISDMARDYSQKVIRGREMILLGVKKAYLGIIDHQENVVVKIKEEIREHTK